jgi:ubiquinone/menaquinone biosynthesis C-methylase UbiE
MKFSYGSAWIRFLHPGDVQGAGKLMKALAKDWDRHVIEAEEVARGVGFGELRDLILERAEPRPADRAIDLGAGTGLLSLPLAAQVSRLWAIDISPAMCEYLRVKATSAGLTNVEVAVASAVSLPLVDGAADLVVSNYCLHHLSNEDKHRALREIHRVLAPGGRVVLGDMMFRPALNSSRDRKVLSAKVRALVRKGPSGVVRLVKNGARFAAARWEKPVRPEWWGDALLQAGFVAVSVEPLPHEGGIASAKKPL